MLGRLLRSERGQSVVVAAVVITTLLGFLSVSLDAGRVFVTKEKLQGTADGAALAGAAYLPNNPTQAVETALATAEANGLSASQVTISVAGLQQNELKVDVKATENLYFGPLIGIPRAGVAAAATAASGAIQSLRGLIPIGVYEGTYVTGQTYALKQDTGSGGNFGALWYGDGDPGANTYRSDLENGSPAEVTLGETVATKPGDMVGPTEQGLSARMSAPATPVGDVTSPRYVFLPVVTEPDDGRSSVTVVGFAAFWLESDSGGEVTGIFLHRVMSSDILPADVSTTGLVGVTLIR